MPGQFLVTLGNESQIENALNGQHLKGREEPRIALVGRSNVGKSTLINAMLGARLAQTSAEPGKTRVLHFYHWPEARRIIADLPGYGYAKVSMEDRDRWGELIGFYLKRDPGLEKALVLLDARMGPTDKDEEAIRFLCKIGVNLTIVFTKADALKNQSERVRREREASAKLVEMGLRGDASYWVSAKTKDLGLKRLIQSLSIVPK